MEIKRMGDRVRKRQAGREGKMRVVRLQKEVMKQIRKSDTAGKVQEGLFDASVEAVLAIDGAVEALEGLGEGGEGVMREVKGKVEGLREKVTEAVMAMGLGVKQEQESERGEEQVDEREQDKGREQLVERGRCCIHCGKFFSTKSNTRRHELQQHRDIMDS